MNDIPIEFNLDAGVMRRVNEILSLLSSNNLNKKEDLEIKYKLLITLYNELYPKIKKDNLENIKVCEDVLEKLQKELKRYNNGIGQTFFKYYADIFEREMRLFIEEKINNKGDYD